MTLQGTLTDFPLPDVLSLLASTKKSGELRVGGDESSGRIWLDDGEVVGGEARGTDDPVEVLFELLRLPDGSFAFARGIRPPAPARPTPLPALLEEAQARLEEWRVVESVVPSLGVHARLVAEAPASPVVLEAGQWRVVVALAEGRTVQAVAHSLSLGEFAACKAVKELVDAGLVAVDPETASATAIGPGITAPAEGYLTTHTGFSPRLDEGLADRDGESASSPEAPVAMPDGTRVTGSLEGSRVGSDQGFDPSEEGPTDPSAQPAGPEGAELDWGFRPRDPHAGGPGGPGYERPTSWQGTTADAIARQLAGLAAPDPSEEPEAEDGGERGPEMTIEHRGQATDYRGEAADGDQGTGDHDQAIEYGGPATGDTEQSDQPTDDGEQPTEDEGPANRRLLLKFLSNVRS